MGKGEREKTNRSWLVGDWRSEETSVYGGGSRLAMDDSIAARSTRYISGCHALFIKMDCFNIVMSLDPSSSVVLWVGGGTVRADA